MTAQPDLTALEPLARVIADKIRAVPVRHCPGGTDDLISELTLAVAIYTSRHVLPPGLPAAVVRHDPMTDEQAAALLAPLEAKARALRAEKDAEHRASVLREAADIAESLRQFERATGARWSAQVSENVGILRVADELRRRAACQECDTGVGHTEHCPYPESHNWGCGCPTDQSAASRPACPDPIECSHEAALGEARETNQRLNYRAQQLESELATYRRAVSQWQVSDRGTYIPLRTISAIAKAAGRDIEHPRWILHYQRVEQAEAAIERVRSYLASQTDAFPANYPVAVPAADVLANLDTAPVAGLRGEAGETQQGERPRCPHCRMTHDLTPEMAAVCASIRASVAEQPAVVAQPDKEPQQDKAAARDWGDLEDMAARERPLARDIVTALSRKAAASAGQWPPADETQPSNEPALGFTGKGRAWCLTCPRPDDENAPLTLQLLAPYEECAGCHREIVEVARAQQPDSGSTS
ncbi:hypothetical protein ACFYRN_45165 [Streptomyces sp. NPDC005227]|uniref:hypothetical protein n=1 Tax=Streptomyces sp. NPDC005227 TaxID=3364707 RepID=UPI00369C0A07